jgi:hypothetical protein
MLNTTKNYGWDRPAGRKKATGNRGGSERRAIYTGRLVPVNHELGTRLSQFEFIQYAIQRETQSLNSMFPPLFDSTEEHGGAGKVARRNYKLPPQIVTLSLSKGDWYNNTCFDRLRVTALSGI